MHHLFWILASVHQRGRSSGQKRHPRLFSSSLCLSDFAFYSLASRDSGDIFFPFHRFGLDLRIRNGFLGLVLSGLQ